MAELRARAQNLSLGLVNDTQVSDVLRSTKGLAELALEAPVKLLSFSKGIRPLIDANATSLTSVHLAGSESIKDKTVEHVLRACVNLASLDLHGCRKVKGTAFSVLHKVKAPPKLSHVDVSLCEFNKSGFKVSVCVRDHVLGRHSRAFVIAGAHQGRRVFAFDPVGAARHVV